MVVIIFWDFLIFYLILLSPKVNRDVIISGVYIIKDTKMGRSFQLPQYLQKSFSVSETSGQFSLVAEFHGNWKTLEYRIYDNQDFFYPICAIFVQKYQNCPLKMKFGTHTTCFFNQKTIFCLSLIFRNITLEIRLRFSSYCSLSLSLYFL